MTLRENVAFRRLFLGRLVTNAGDRRSLVATRWLVDAPASTVAVGVYYVGVSTIRRTVVPDRLLGRVSSASASAAGAATPVGALLGGLAGEAVGVLPAATVSVGILAMWALSLVVPGLRGLPSIDRVEPADLGIVAVPTPTD